MASTYLGVAGGKSGAPSSTYLAPNGNGNRVASPASGGNTTSAYFSATNQVSGSGAYSSPSGAGNLTASQASTANRGKIGELEDRIARLENDVRRIDDVAAKNKRLEAALRSIAADALRELSGTAQPEARDASSNVVAAPPSGGNSTMTAVGGATIAAPANAAPNEYFSTPSERTRSKANSTYLTPNAAGGTGGSSSGWTPQANNTTSAYLGAPGSASGSGAQSAYFGVGGGGVSYPKQTARNNASAYMAPSGGVGGAAGATSAYLAPK